MGITEEEEEEEEEEEDKDEDQNDNDGTRSARLDDSDDVRRAIRESTRTPRVEQEDDPVECIFFIPRDDVVDFDDCRTTSSSTTPPTPPPTTTTTKQKKQNGRGDESRGRCLGYFHGRTKARPHDGGLRATKITSRSTSRRLVPEEGFNAARVSFGTIGMSVGLPLLLYGFGAYFSFLPGTGVSAIMLIYGFPISLIGFALKYAELLPLECEAYEDAVNVREEQATAVLTQLRNDVTRYRYGDEQHLEEAMNIVFKFNRPGGLQKRQRPKLVGVSEQMVNGRYAI